MAGMIESLDSAARPPQVTYGRKRRVTRVFGKSPRDGDLEGITIYASALYLLSAPSVPVQVREEAAEKVENGDWFFDRTFWLVIGMLSAIFAALVWLDLRQF
jgi:hypothetical protein